MAQEETASVWSAETVRCSGEYKYHLWLTAFPVASSTNIFVHLTYSSDRSTHLQYVVG
jgi:hypothetical protein